MNPKLQTLAMIGGLLSYGACFEDCTNPPDQDAGPPAFDGGKGPAIFDALSRPEEPTLSVNAFASAADCGSCHEQHYEEWSSSMHAYAMVDPVFRALVWKRQEDHNGAQDTFCVQCHSAIGTRSGEITENFSFDTLSDVVLEGVTCQACHLVSHVERPNNSGHFISQFGPIRGPIEDPVDTPFHDSEFSPIYEESVFCAGCHDVIELNGLNLERPYAEWLESPGADKGKTCQSCHMPEYIGRASVAAPERTLHRHRFVGAEVPLLEGFASEEKLATIREDVAELLDGALALSLQTPESVLSGEQLDLVIHVRNEIDSHNYPTGSTFIRQSWLEVIATDSENNILYSTGLLDANGDLKDHFSELEPYSDADLISFSSRLLREDGEPELLPWRATEHVSNSISPNYDRSYTLFVPTGEVVAGPIQISVRVLFRSMPPYLLRYLELDDLIAKLEIFEVASKSVVVTVEE
jgi:hypothetical protein